MQDPRIQSLRSLPGQMHPVIPPGAIPEEYLRRVQPFTTSEDPRFNPLPFSLEPTAATAHATAVAAYYRPAYLHHPWSLPRMEESLCLSALQSQFNSVPPRSALAPVHPSSLHLHLPGGQYSEELKHTVLAERLQMENKVRQRSREQEREREREREAALERERERDERNRELDRQKERQRDRQQQIVRAAETYYFSELQTLRAPPEDRTRPVEKLAPNKLDKPKEPQHPVMSTSIPLSLQLGHHSTRVSVPHLLPSLVYSHWGKRGQESGGPLELGFRTEGNEMHTRRDERNTSVNHSTGKKDFPSGRGAPLPLMSPKGPCRPPVPPTTLWNPASLVDLPTDFLKRRTPPTLPYTAIPPPGLTRADGAPVNWAVRLENWGSKREDGPVRHPPLRGAGLQESCVRAGQDKVMQSLHQHHNPNKLQQRSCLPQSQPSNDPGRHCLEALPSPVKEQKSQALDNMLVYDEVLQQHRRLLSKLDLEERKRREAREGGYFNDMDESCPESDEEEVKTHVRRVTEQGPLKLDTSSEKVVFLHMCGLTTLTHRDELLSQKRRKRRRMLRERSPSPPAVLGKRMDSSLSARSVSLTTTYSAEQMDSSPRLEEKKDFLLKFNLSHVSQQQRRDKEKTEQLLRAIQRKTVTLDTLRYNPVLPYSSPASPTPDHLQRKPNRHEYPESRCPSLPVVKNPENLLNTTFKRSLESRVPQIPRPLAPSHENSELMKVVANRKLHVGVNISLLKKEVDPVKNGSQGPWERIVPEAFAQRFHKVVLQSTQNSKYNKEVTNNGPDVDMEAELHTISHLKHSGLHRTHVNGHRLCSPAVRPDTAGLQKNSDKDVEEYGQEEEEEDNNDDEEDEVDEEERQAEKEEAEEAPRRWQGIEAVFESYQDYVNEWSIEKQVLRSQCKRLENHNSNLSRTVEQLSRTMSELVSYKQKAREERERLQTQLELFRRCLTLPRASGQVSAKTPT